VDLLAFVPSSLMLGVTSSLSTDVAAIPLFWVIPLALYLLSFIIVFGQGSGPGPSHCDPAFAPVDMPKWTVFGVHLANFFLVCMVCHGRSPGQGRRRRI